MYSEVRLPQCAVLWWSTGSGGSVIPADGCVDLILRDGRVAVAGPSTRWIATGGDGNGGSFGLRLPPGRASGLLRNRLAEVADQLVPLDDVLCAERAGDLREAMVRLRYGSGPVSHLMSIEEQASADGRWSREVNRHAAGAVPAKRVAAELDESERTFRRRMLATFGYGYTTLVRIERARRAQTLLRRGVLVSEPAATAGLADQPHLSREIRRLVGVSPVQLARSSA